MKHATTPNYHLDTLEGLVAACKQNPAAFLRGSDDLTIARSPRGLIFCQCCMKQCPAAAVCLDEATRGGAQEGVRRALGLPFLRKPDTISAETLSPAMFALQCLICSTPYIAVIYPGESGTALAMLPGARGSETLPGVPAEVLMYLRQALLCRLVGAHTAALSMFRAALEAFLCDQGFVADFNLSKKIKAFQDAASATAEKPWMRHVTPDMFDALKQLGDWATHSDRGKFDASKHAIMDEKLSAAAATIFHFMLQQAYVAPAELAQRLAQVSASVNALQVPSATPPKT